MSNTSVNRLLFTWLILSVLGAIASYGIASKVGKTYFFTALNVGNALALIMGCIFRRSILTILNRIEQDFSRYETHNINQEIQFNVLELQAGKLCICIGAIVALFFAYTMKEPEAYYALIDEDGIVENGSALLWAMAACVLLATILVTVKRNRANRLFSSFFTLMLLFFVVCAGEEISWGQRLFDLKTLDIMDGINVQGENNLHNIGSISVFSNLFFLIMLSYFAIIPYFLKKYGSIHRYIDHYSLISPNKHNTIIFTIALIIWAIAGLRFGTLGFHPYSFFAENYYTQMDDEIFEFFSAYTFFAYSVTTCLHLIGEKQLPSPLPS